MSCDRSHKAGLESKPCQSFGKSAPVASSLVTDNARVEQSIAHLPRSLFWRSLKKLRSGADFGLVHGYESVYELVAAEIARLLQMPLHVKRAILVRLLSFVV